ncbi:MAG TPA: FHA domain-containing protein [Streptosporangiaceae bacterium]|jgi:hypothetical protein|nr:FHA domain-containing protein [Streptosporangiaceae bacterium]
MALTSRKNRRWQIVAGIVVAWIILWIATGSVGGAFIFLIVIAALGTAAFFGLRALGVNRDHPWVQRMSSRPWRDGQDVLQQALKHLPEVFVVTPNGTLLAPDIVDLRMNPEDLQALGERMDPSLVMESAAEVYQEAVSAHNARLARRAPMEVRIIADPGMPPGRFRLRQGQPVNNYVAPDGPQGPQAPQDPGRPMAPEPAPAEPPAPVSAAPYPRPQLVPDQGAYGASDGHTRAQDRTATVSGFPTVLEQNHHAAPPLRLITGGKVAETTISGARAGRGHSVELGLPEVPTVSREHAKFTYDGGQWYVTNLGMNGITVNGRPVTGEHPVQTGDSIRWGTRPDALQSEVQIG